MTWMRHRMTRWGRTLLWTVFCGPWATGCDFFQELESVPGATTTETDTDTDTEGTASESTQGAACEVLNDDRCLDQDTVASCSPADGTMSEVDCVALCGSYVNFSCVLTGSGQHACWCVEPGDYKVLSCAELEDCMEGCDLSGSLECADTCFSRTDALTVRVYGALVHCAEATCMETCAQTPEQCLGCIEAARTEGSGGCSLPRAVCDDDRNPDEPWG